MYNENEGADNEFLPNEQKGYRIQNTPTINCNYIGANWHSMSWINLIVNSHALHNVAGAYLNTVNDIATFVETTPQTNIITHEIILTQYIIKQGIKVFEKGKSEVQK